MDEGPERDNAAEGGPVKRRFARTRGQKVFIVLALVCLVAAGVCFFLSYRVHVQTERRVYMPPLEEHPWNASSTVKVLLISQAQELSVNCRYGGLWRALGEGDAGSIAVEKGAWKVMLAPAGLGIGNKTLRAAAAVFTPAGQTFTLGGRSYRGELVVEKKEDGLRAINSLGLEDYVRSVVASEMSRSWPLEALMAQAVAARTFALYRLEQRKKLSWNLSIYDLAYRGRSAECRAADRAVELTQGVVMTYGGKLLPAYFHSTCGGRTASAQKVFGEQPLPPLAGVECGWCWRSPHYRWRALVSQEHITQALAKWDAGVVRSIEPLGTDPDGRATFVKVNGTTQIPADEFRAAVEPRSLKSTDFVVQREGESFVFEGKGWGHGVGLCQWGARQQAAAGRNWQQILNFYYPGVTLKRISPGSP